MASEVKQKQGYFMKKFNVISKLGQGGFNRGQRINMTSEVKQKQGYFMKKFNVISKLGQGGFGAVFEVKTKMPLIVGALEIIPVSNISYEQEKTIERCVIHMKEKYKDIVTVTCWKESKPADLIAQIWTESNDDEENASSTQESDSIELIFWDLSFYNTRSLNTQYLFVYMMWDDEECVSVEDWIDIRKKSKHLNMDFNHTSNRSLFPNENKSYFMMGEDMRIMSKQKGAFGTLFRLGKFDWNMSYALKIIALPQDAVEREKYIRECLALQKMKEGENMRFAMHSTPIIEGWREQLSKDFISIIWPEETDQEEEYTDEYETLSTSTQEASDSSSIQFASSSQDDEITRENDDSVSELSSLQNDTDIQQDNEYLFIRMRMCGKQTLRDWMQSNKVRDRKQVDKIYRLIVEGVKDIHSREMIHRDLKPENIFYVADGDFVFVGDFGLATSMHNAQSHIDPNRVKGGKYEHTKHVGTTTYMSPEQLEGKEYNHKVDVYALGIILFELLVPFGSAHERGVTLANLRKGLFPADFQSEHPEEYELIKSMLSLDPNQRPEVKNV